MGGRVTNTVAAQVANISGRTSPTSMQSGRFSMILHGVSFVSGFTFVFVAIGLLTTAFIRQISGQSVGMVTDIIGRLGGVLIIFFGIHFMGVLPSFFAWIRRKRGADLIAISTLFMLSGGLIILWGLSGTIAVWEPSLWAGDTAWAPALALIWLVIFLLWLFLGGAFTRPEKFWNDTLGILERWLYADTRQQIGASRQRGYSGSVIMGVIFSAGWTPCIGPVYGAVLTMAANGGDPGRAGALLGVYSLGLGVPFLLTTLLLDRVQGILRNMQRHMRKIELVSGAFLVLIGIAVASGELQSLSATFASDQFAQAATDLESSVIERLTGQSVEDGAETVDAVENSGLTFIEPGTIYSSENAIDGIGASLSSPLNTIEEAAQTVDGFEVGTDVGNLAPTFEAITDNGETVTLLGLRGQVVLLNFWATWCGPCRLEMPEFQKTCEALAGDGFAIVAVNNRETVEDVIGFREEYDLTFPLVMDEQGEIQDRYGVMMYPSTYVIGRDGLIVARHFGALTVTQLQELVDRAMG
jgi:cytochrome c biogenesis protein CcdA/peroxiredoxin